MIDSDPEPDADPAGFVALPFVVAGPPDEAREFTIELLTRVAADAEVLLELPLRFARDFKADLKIERVDENATSPWRGWHRAGISGSVRP